MAKTNLKQAKQMAARADKDLDSLADYFEAAGLHDLARSVDAIDMSAVLDTLDSL